MAIHRLLYTATVTYCDGLRRQTAREEAIRALHRLLVGDVSADDPVPLTQEGEEGEEGEGEEGEGEEGEEGERQGATLVRPNLLRRLGDDPDPNEAGGVKSAVNEARAKTARAPALPPRRRGRGPIAHRRGLRMARSWLLPCTGLRSKRG